MNCKRVFLALLAVVFLAAGCGHGSATNTGTAGSTPGPTAGPTSTPTDTPSTSATPEAGSTGGPPATVSGGTSVPKATGTARADAHKGSSSSEGGAMGAPVAGSAYWASDGRHYWQGTDGRWYFDAYTVVDSERDMYRIFDYQRRELYDFASYRDANGRVWSLFRSPNMPMYSYVRWAAWPAGTTATAQNLFLILHDSFMNQDVWFTADQVARMSAAWTGGQYGIPNSGTLPTDPTSWFAGEGANALTWAQPNCAYPNTCRPL